MAIVRELELSLPQFWLLASENVTFMRDAETGRRVVSVAMSFSQVWAVVEVANAAAAARKWRGCMLDDVSWVWISVGDGICNECVLAPRDTRCSEICS